MEKKKQKLYVSTNEKRSKKKMIEKERTNVKTNLERIKKKKAIKSENKFNNIYLYSYL